MYSIRLYLRDMYRPGMVIEQWNPETRSHDRYVTERVKEEAYAAARLAKIRR
ncbi:TPA: hypothetical protein J1W37_004197 [Escherichia coli]|nr:hypothetical protein [Escherichia coli]HBA7645748.1 hypothetical protein [Escherichia coli]HBA7654849.1 hypothetical protein [Escherichia coli]HBA7728040.1 hypothetical protein [Escherichia coli]HBA7732051.1 hypothetical protein [Escherichia coli]